MEAVMTPARDRYGRYFLYFMLYSVIGWCYEVFLEVAVYRWGYSDRGVLFGPYCPVYGVGALVFLFTVYRLIRGRTARRRLAMLPAVFLGCMLAATAVELAASYLCEWTMGYWPWQTYAGYRYNFQARIALSPSLRFGLGGVLFLYVMQPLFERLADRMGQRGRDIAAAALAAVFVLDCAASVLARL